MVCLNAKKCTDSTLCPDSQSACTIVQTRKHCSNVFRTCSIVCFIHMISYDHTKTRATQTFKEKHDCLERFIYIRIYIYSREMATIFRALSSCYRGRHRTRYLYFVGQGETATSCQVGVVGHSSSAFVKPTNDLCQDFKKGFRQAPWPFSTELRSATPRHSGEYLTLLICILEFLSPLGGDCLQDLNEFV